MASSDQKASAGVYVTPDVGLEVTDGTYSRVQIGKIGTGTQPYGIKVLSSDGTTVIIDGTSDIFKIASTATQTTTEATGAGQQQSTIALSSLGTFTGTPAGIFWQSVSALATDAKLFGHETQIIVGWLANASGGATTTSMVAFTLWGYSWTFLDGSNHVNVESNVINRTGASFTMVTKYYILVEAAM